MKGIFDMTTRLKILPEEKKDPSKIETCSCLDKSAYTRKLFTKKECKEIMKRLILQKYDRIQNRSFRATILSFGRSLESKLTT